MKSSLGNFGHIQYGTTIGSHLNYDANNTQGCDPFISTFPTGQKIVLVEAGGCPVTQKVRNIEAAGGQLAVIGDAFFENVEDVYMEDIDGSGFSLTIPAMMIDRIDANLILEYLLNNTKIKMKAVLEVSKTDKKLVEVSLWYGSSLDLPMNLI